MMKMFTCASVVLISVNLFSSSLSSAFVIMLFSEDLNLVHMNMIITLEHIMDCYRNQVTKVRGNVFSGFYE